MQIVTDSGTDLGLSPEQAAELNIHNRHRRHKGCRLALSTVTSGQAGLSPTCTRLWHISKGRQWRVTNSHHTRAGMGTQNQ